MPTYAYSCSCGESFDKYVHVDHRDRVKCRCGQLARRGMSRPVFVIPAQFANSLSEIEALTQPPPEDLATGKYSTHRSRFGR